MLLLESAMIGVFVSLDLFLFYVFWDAMLIPMYFLIGIWGYDRRIYAAVKFMLYTMAGSVLMLLAILGLAVPAPARRPARYSFDLLKLYDAADCPRDLQFWFFLAFALAFAIKVPLFPFHTWLPDAHVEAPTAGSVILAGVLLKMGTYGLVRFAFPLFPVAALVLRAVPRGARGHRHRLRRARRDGAAGHEEARGLLERQPPRASSCSASAAMNVQGVQGAVYQMLSHGVSTGGLFLIVGMLSDRRHTRLIARVRRPEDGDAAAGRRRSCIVTLASIGLPGLNGFVGEFLILLGAFRVGSAVRGGRRRPA